MPKAPEWTNRNDHTATPANWIVPGAVAFVARTPWIENMSVKENILFSLPVDQDRYQNCLRSCSLEKDLEMFPDGDGTEIGPNGVNLSGGQRWRVALARALYSRAEILVLDDIFSAVTAHVGACILENALTGELAQGRTRIVATHNTSLVASKANYHCVLGDGTVQHGGPVEGLIDVAGQMDSPTVKAQESTRDPQETAGHKPDAPGSETQRSIAS